MIKKYPVYPDRVRKIPKSFSWIDHRLVREGYIEQVSHSSGILYLFLLAVSDAQGLSYYSDGAVCQRLKMDQATLDESREELIHTDLIAYKRPLYQVLSLDLVYSRPMEERSSAIYESGSKRTRSCKFLQGDSGPTGEGF